MTLHRSTLFFIFLFSFIFSFTLPISALAATSPSLGSTSSYGITSSTYTNSLNAGLETAITGDVCYTTPPGTAPISISGATVVPCAPARGTDQSTALADLNGQSCTSLGANVVLSGTYTPGCYSSSGTMDITLGTTVTLNGAGTYIFRSGGALTTGANSVIALSGGASACDIFWTPTGLASLGANSSTSATPTFVGNIIANALGSTGITLGHFVNLSGRALAFGHTVTTDSNTITAPTCAPSAPILNVIKTVTNDNGGTASASDWTLTVSSSNAGSGTGSAVGSVAGTPYTLEAGKAYSVVESGGPIGYLGSGSADCTIASAVANTTYTCTITNNDVAPQLIVNKVVVNNNGKTKVISDFPLFIDGGGVTSGVTNTTTIGSHTVSETSDGNYTAVISGDCAANGTITLALSDLKTCVITNDDIAASSGGGSGGSSQSIIPPLINIVKVPSPLALPNGPGPVSYTYTLYNIGTVAVTDITMVDNTCSPNLISGDTNNDAKLDINEVWTYTCFAKLSQTHTNIITVTGWANGISAVDIATATVVVGMSLVPPLIHVTKIPSPLALFAGGGMITYTNKVTNPGTVPLSNVRLVDDKCGPVNYVSGDTNGDSMLDIIETWTYTCQTNLTQTTTNTITATGWANGISAVDIAIATVVVSAIPGLPNTGFPSSTINENLMMLFVGILILASTSLKIIL